MWCDFKIQTVLKCFESWDWILQLELDLKNILFHEHVQDSYSLSLRYSSTSIFETEYQFKAQSIVDLFFKTVLMY